MRLWAEGIYRGLAYSDVGNTLDIDDSFRVNAQIDLSVSPQVEVYVRGENLTNDRTPDAFGFDYPGAAVYGGIVLKP